MPTIYDPIKIGALQLPNRMAVAPTVKNHADEEGYVTDRVTRGFVEEARGGWGLLQVSASFIHPEGNIFRRMIGIHNDRAISGLERLAYAIHREGTKCSIQLIHGGALCNTAITGLPTVGAGEKGIFGPTRKLSTGEVEERVQYYVEAAARAKEAGFDAVNVHSCQGTLVQQFMSPYTNERDDKFGEDPGLFPEMIAKGIKERCGKDFPLIWRLAAREFMEVIGQPGYDEEWGKKIAKRLEPWVDCFDVTGGRIGFTSMYSFPPVYAERATRVHLAAEIKKVVSVPVMGVAKIMDQKLAEDVVASGRCDIAHFCRPAIADPWFARKVLEGRPEDIRKCIACNWCLETLFRQRVVVCAVNPAYSREGEYELKPAPAPKKVLVVGGGVAGMECALTLAQRGHKVDLHEKGEELGGAVQFVASGHPRLNTRDLRNIVDYHVVQLEKTPGVKVHLNSEVTAALIEKENPDAVVIACGAEEVVPDIPGIRGPKVILNDAYLRSEGEIDVGQDVVILGGNYGAETAVSLAREKKHVTVVEETETHTRPVYITDFWSRTLQLDKYVQDEKITILTKTRAIEITNEGVVVDSGDGRRLLPADTVIVACDRKPGNGLKQALGGRVKELYEIGDCVAARDIASAIDDAAYVGRKI